MLEPKLQRTCVEVYVHSTMEMSCAFQFTLQLEVG
jgi:hypothetical protein